ncbi:uncharacterized protein LOC129801923 [Phlebotomus papatasi]|uniref:uncharacterized protein LOC129801923 n=1 Tax=Phlebotomus papatasi TaxID=29031 RepID=UPI0024838B75|nr:uncharacterized protein LOC129801923 [Phlebotomus papatasi]XP_055703384.1 uncharacterized protein LOC129801923 [Phlebotomus papatasi]
MVDVESKIELPEYVNEEIVKIAQSLDFPNPKFKVMKGSKNGDNFSGDVFRVLVVREDGVIPEDDASADRSIYQRELHLFVKLAPQSLLRRRLYKTVLCFEREMYMYDVILPRYAEFEKQYLSKDETFHNYPHLMCGSLQESKEYLILSDLKREGYFNPHRSTGLNLHQCKLVLATMAKFHAISYAFKDQHPEQFNELTSKLIETMFAEPIPQEMQDFLQRKIAYGLSTLSDLHDKKNRNHLEQFGANFAQNMISCVHVKDFGAIIHGDSWISNLIFRFKNNVEEDVKLLDWQLSRHTTPVLDLSYFIFCCTDVNLRIHLPALLNEYHDILIRRIDKLGSSGRHLYPKNIFEEHCKKYMKYGVGMALMTLHSVTCKSTEIPNVVEIIESQDLAQIDAITEELVKRPAYIRRMSGVIRDAVRFGYI